MFIKENNGITFELNKENFSARVISSPKAKGDLFFPRSINYESHEYLITSIQKNAFKHNDEINSINFAEDSKLHSIHKKAFSYSSLQSITLPPNLEFLEEGWCAYMYYLNNIYISPKNKNYKFLDSNNRIIIGKSDPKSENYDTLVYSCNISLLKIPSTIKHISSFSFSQCKLRQIEFEENPQLETIGKKALNFSYLSKLYIPSSVKELKNGWNFRSSKEIKILLSSENKRYKYIDNGRLIVGKSDPKNEDYDSIIFAHNQIEQVTISSSIKYICSYAFLLCKKLKKVEFSKDSKLISIGKGAFKRTSIESIVLPSTVKKIENETFSFCSILKELNCSEIFSIGKKILCSSNITSITIPSTLAELEEGWCDSLQHLIHVDISPENKNFTFLDEDKKIIIGKLSQKSDNFDAISFACRDIEQAFVGSSIKRICSFAFANCVKLTKVTFSEDSQLISIGNEAFSGSLNIKTIKIPSTVEQIGKMAFANCLKLVSIETPNDSHLKSIQAFTFCNTLIEKVCITEKVEELSKYSFEKMLKLNCIEISKENKNFSCIDENGNIITAKSDSKNGPFDSILSVCGDHNIISIPPSIECIRSHSFLNCKSLQMINFSRKTELTTIDAFSFSHSPIVELLIPSTIRFIGAAAFSFCDSIQKVEFESDSKLEIFSRDLFSNSSIETISIPTNIKELQNGWCSYTFYLNNVFLSPQNKNFSYLDKEKKIIIGKSDLNSDVFDVISFVCRDVEKVDIPNSIKIISSSSFQYTKINKLFIPKSVVKIENNAFLGCSYLKTIEFEEGGDMIDIGECAFSDTSIESLYIPCKKIENGIYSFDYCQSLKTIELLGEDLLISDFTSCQNIFLVSFPNALNVFISSNYFNSSCNISIFMLHNSNVILI